MALLFTGQYFHEFHKKVEFHENIIVKLVMRELPCYNVIILAS